MSFNIIGGAFAEVTEAEKTIQDLLDLGFTKDDISVFAQDEDQVEALEENRDMEVTTDSEDRGSNAGKGLGWGALSGGILGGIAGLVAGGIAVSIPGAAPLVVAGAGSTGLAGALSGIVGGGVIGVLVGAGLPENQAKEYEEFIEDGKIVVIVKVSEAQKQEAQDVMNKSGSQHTTAYAAEE